MVEDFVIVCGRGEVHKTIFLSFSFFFLIYLKNGGRRWNNFCEAGNGQCLGKLGVFWKRNALGDYEPFVSNANSAKPRILAFITHEGAWNARDIGL